VVCAVHSHGVMSSHWDAGEFVAQLERGEFNGKLSATLGTMSCDQLLEVCQILAARGERFRHNSPLSSTTDQPSALVESPHRTTSGR